MHNLDFYSEETTTTESTTVTTTYTNQNGLKLRNRQTPGPVIGLGGRYTPPTTLISFQRPFYNADSIDITISALNEKYLIKLSLFCRMTYRTRKLTLTQ